MKQIAILKANNIHYYEDRDIFIESISDWSEVTDEEFNMLTRYLRSDTYVVIERVDLKKDFIANTVKSAIEHARKVMQDAENAAQAAERKKQERLLKKKAKDAEAELKLLEQLKEKYEKE